MPRGDIAIVLGARPKMIKLAGVIQAACGRAHVANTGQQRVATRVLTLVK
jgi:UDP-N-acetylglucosamine 2-epimerase